VNTRTSYGGGVESRPPLRSDLSGAELQRWYWTLAELTKFARHLSVPASGGKQALTARLAAVLDGTPPPPPAPRRAVGRQLTEPLTVDTVLPPGQRCSQTLRAWFLREVDPAFHFDAGMRTFVAEGAGRTLGEAANHWHATRESAARHRPIGAQFEFNAFLRRRAAARPGSSRAEHIAAWKYHRSRPAEDRTGQSGDSPRHDAQESP
jgi:hypothetical protein